MLKVGIINTVITLTDYLIIYSTASMLINNSSNCTKSRISQTLSRMKIGPVLTVKKATIKETFNVIHTCNCLAK